jgi:hypothetical protein
MKADRNIAASGAPACATVTPSRAALARAVPPAHRSTPQRGSLVAAGVALALASAAHAFPPEFEVSSLLPGNGGDGSAGLVLNGGLPSEESGLRVAGAGDVNGDGFDDVLVAGDGPAASGFVYLVLGGATAGPVLPLDAIAQAGGNLGTVMTGPRHAYIGSDVSTAGDVNGDGVDDVIVGSEMTNFGGRINVGVAYVVFGRTEAQGGLPAQVNLAGLYPGQGGDGTRGFVIGGISIGDRLGTAVNTACDVNGDGIDDIVLGAADAEPDAARDDSGEAYVIFGRDVSQADAFPPVFSLRVLLPDFGGDGSAGFVLNGAAPNDRFGRSVAPVGDVNADGIDDFIVGASSADGGGRNRSGQSYVVYGRRTGFPAIFEVRDLLVQNGGDGTAGFALNGVEPDDTAGQSVSGLGDVNGDGIADFAIGTYNVGPDDGTHRDGAAYVVFGRAAQSGPFPPEFELSTLLAANGGDGMSGFVLDGSEDNGWLGFSLGAADVNGDGTRDVVVGAQYSDGGGRSESGQAFVVYGRDVASDGPFAPEIQSASLMRAGGGDGTEGFVMNGIGFVEFDLLREASLGHGVAGAGDVNADGIEDVVVGSPLMYPGGVERAGQTYILYGSTAAPPPDTDADGVANADDACPATTMPEPVPTVELAEGRYALTADNNTFNSNGELGQFETNYSTTYTAGCSCAQIIAALGLGPDETMFGCTQESMLTWMQAH